MTPAALTGFVKSVHAETLKPGLAPGTAFVLVEWCSILLQELSGTENWEKWGLETIEANAHALDLCLSGSSKPNLKHSALVVTRRGLRKVFSESDTRQNAIEGAVHKLSSKASHPTLRNAIMLGVIAGVCARKSGAREILASKTSEYYTFYNREIIGSRTPVPPYIASALGDFFVAFAPKEDIEKEIIPALEKSLLRAPEIVLDDLVTPLFHSLPEQMDLSDILHKNLLKPLLANIKSSNVTIRRGALSAFEAAVVKCHDVEVIAKITEEILAPLKNGKLLSADQRGHHAEMLALLPVSNITAAMVSSAIALVASKESAEAALNLETIALLHYISWSVLNGVDLDKKVVETFVKGLSDKKVPFKKMWSIRFGELLWAINDTQVLKSRLSSLVELSMPALMDIWQEVIANPILSVQSGLVTSAYIITSITQVKLAVISSASVDSALKKAQISKQALTMEPKPSFLLNPRIYGKLASDDEFSWFTRALAAVPQDLADVQPDSAVAIGWSQAIIHCVCSSAIKPSLRQEALGTLSRLYAHSPISISKLIIAGLWRWRHSIESGEKESASVTTKSENEHIHKIAGAICLHSGEVSRLGENVPEIVRRDQMIDLLVLARPELLPRVSWIDLCLRVEVDPGDLARTSANALMQQIIDHTSFDKNVCH